MFELRSLPFRGIANWRYRWLYLTSGRSVVLHRIARLPGSIKKHREWPHGMQGTTLCGRDGKWSMPGIFSRIGAPRCAQCCKLLGIPRGNGHPYNSGMPEPYCARNPDRVAAEAHR